MPRNIMVVGLPDKAVAESRERVRSALIASGLALPAKRITVNLAPADLPKEGSHYDLPIALAVMAAIGADRKSTRLNSSHANISYAVFCFKKKKHLLSPPLPTKPLD